MKKLITIIVVGILSILVPLLGFPGSWKTGFAVIAGLVIVWAAASLYRQTKNLIPENPSQQNITPGE
ncbi:MAG: hypothetical protein PHF79_03085 [Candidatus Pacebacteria bacterium]|nr:hypothetical protein [Candidatus Paceibacterota bacterium]